jgi:putative CocE/NonD family hydrolase
MGPWVHGGWARQDGDALGDVRFGSKTSLFYRERIELPFFQRHLKGAKEHGLPEASVFATGSNRWHALPAWPPPNAKPTSFFLLSDGRLSAEAPAEEKAFDEYVSDPKKPVPYIGGIAIGMTKEYMVEDQRFAGRRPDVLVYQSDVLRSDLTVAGPVTASLHVSTSGTDSDWVVKLIDVYPDSAPEPDSRPGSRPTRMGGYQQLVRGEPMRGKFRNSFEKPEPFEPNVPAKVEFTMPDVFHTFLAGHRVMVQVQSSWFPLVNLNPQRFLNINQARDSDFEKATQRVYRSRSMASRVILRVLEP